MGRTPWRLSKIVRESCWSEPSMRKLTRFGLRSRMSEWVSRRRQATNFLRLSTQPRRMEWESACLSAVPLSRLTMDAFGRYGTTDPAQHLPFVYLAAARSSLGCRQLDQIYP